MRFFLKECLPYLKMYRQSKEKWGPGRWQSIHVTAAWADTPDKVKFFNSWIRDQIEHLPCEECRKHAREYIRANPPEEAEDPFIWSWRFHNAANRRLGKPEFEYNVAKKLYLDGGITVCNEGCGGGGGQNKNEHEIGIAFNFRPSRF